VRRRWHISTLYLCATPIGNLGDVSERLAEVLRSVDVVYAEDTRRTATLLRFVDSDRPVRSYFVGNEAYRATEVGERLTEGQDVALVTDAGTPAVADPGVSAVAAAIEVGATVTVVPGPSAVTAALALAGFGGDRFVFEGFLPRRGEERRIRASEIAAETRPVVLFCSPRRVTDDLSLLAEEAGGDRQVCVCRELTKQYEEVFRGTLDEAIEHWTATQPRGEFTVVVDGSRTVDEISLEHAIHRARLLVDAGASKSEAARQVAKETRFPKKPIYDALI
jgi:16S rRNA (cytidine1402-2'-O)-methyltransferase